MQTNDDISNLFPKSYLQIFLSNILKIPTGYFIYFTSSSTPASSGMPNRYNNVNHVWLLLIFILICFFCNETYKNERKMEMEGILPLFLSYVICLHHKRISRRKERQVSERWKWNPIYRAKCSTEQIFGFDVFVSLPSIPRFIFACTLYLLSPLSIAFLSISMFCIIFFFHTKLKEFFFFLKNFHLFSSSLDVKMNFIHPNILCVYTYST